MPTPPGGQPTIPTRAGDPTRIFVWSGPRVISTTMLRAFANRADVHPLDNPFFYVHAEAHGKVVGPPDDPLREYPNTYDQVVDWVTRGDLPDGKSILYAKANPKFLVAPDTPLESVDLSWLGQVTNVFLLRDPGRQLMSWGAQEGWNHEMTRPDHVALPHLSQLFEIARHLGPTVVVEAEDIQADPQGALTKLCERLGIPFSERMLEWEPGDHAAYGPWTHNGYPMYDNVRRSSSIRLPNSPMRESELPAALRSTWRECRAIHAQLKRHAVRLTPPVSVPALG